MPPPPASGRAATDRLDRVEEDTIEHRHEIRDMEREIADLGSKVDGLMRSIDGHEKLDAAREVAAQERHATVQATLVRLETGQRDMLTAFSGLVVAKETTKAAATGELAATSRERIKATTQVVLATLSTVGMIAGLAYGASQIPLPVAPGTAHQQAVEAKWQDKRAEEMREDAVEGAP